MSTSIHCPGCCTQIGCIGSQLHIHKEADKIKGTQAEHMNNSSQSTPYAQGSAQAEQSAKIAHTTQAELDHIADVHEMVVDNSLDGIFDKMGYPKNTDLRKEAIRLITDWHKKQIAKAKIDEWNRLISITRINGERVINQATYSLALDRIAELSGRKDRATKTGAEEK